MFTHNQLNRLENLEEEIIVNKAGLVIIDSIASLVRREFNGHFVRNIYERNKLLSRQASLLKFLASEYNFPVSFPNYVRPFVCRNLYNQQLLNCCRC